MIMRTFDYTILPDELIDHEIAHIIAQIKQESKKLEKIKKSTDKLTRKALLSAIAFTHDVDKKWLENTDLDPLLSGQKEPQTLIEEEILGYFQAYDLIDENHDYMHLSPSLLLHIHKEVFRYTPFYGAGSFKFSCAVVLEDIGLNPPNPFETPTYVENLCKAFNEAIVENKYDPLLLLPVFILDYLCIYPFSNGTEKVACLLAYLLLIQSGYSIGRYKSPAEIVLKDKVGFERVRYESSIGWDNGENTYYPFAKFWLQAILNTYKSALEEGID